MRKWLFGLVMIGFFGVVLVWVIPHEKDWEYGKALNGQDLFNRKGKVVLVEGKKDKAGQIPIGKQNIKVKFENQVRSLTLNVEDHIRPKFKSVEEPIVMNVNDRLFDYIEASDASGVKLSIESAFDASKSGDHQVKVIAKDAHGLTSEKTFKVKVKAYHEPFVKKGIVVVNKKHPVDEKYAPGENEEAVAALREMIAAMRQDGLMVSDYYSGYRSYETQQGLYQNYVAVHGQDAADTFSARPGYSEHQTGLAFDLLDGYGQLIESDPQKTWIAEHAHEYGFIVRFLEGKENITGYRYEPWHVRYVGKKIAKEIYSKHETLEEYLGVSGGDYE